ncbi:MAG: 5'-nucleotidase C-terminal domain-containing protein [Deltaproteobacteria bacterium]|nr:5'-nucleotidase C-terminal domain-containing protein [Deltaproteobacteria bacterium]
MPVIDGCECEPEPGTDAAVADSATAPDAGGTDTRRPDSARPDTHLPDTNVADSHVADSHVADTHVADTHVADTHVADTHVADTHVADTHVADTHVADTHVGDSAQPDASQPDSAVADSAPQPDASQPDSAVADSAPQPDAWTPTPVFWLTTLIVNDQESALLPTSTYGGVARATTVMKDLQAAAAAYQPVLETGEVATVGTLTLGGGDYTLGGSQFQASLDHGVPYYDALAMEEMNFDALGLGNHDFDYGPSILANFIDSFTAPPPFLAANLDFTNEAALAALVAASGIVKHTVLTTGGEQVGVIATVTEDLPVLTTLGEVTVGAILDAINSEVTELEGAGVNKIILISHNQALLRDLELVPQLSGIDIVFSAGGHELLANDATVLFPGDVSDPSRHFPMWVDDADSVPVPIITTNGSYKYIGRLVAKFDASGRLLDIDDALSDPVRVVAGSDPDVATPDAVVDANAVVPVQTYTAGLASNIIAFTEVALDGVRNNVRTLETNEGNLIADAMWWVADSYSTQHGGPYPDVAFVNGGGIRNNNVIGPGDISEGDTYAMLPYTNFVAIVPGVTREDFKEILENAVSRVEYFDGRFAQISGFWFAFDPNGTPRHIDASDTLVHGDRVLWAELDDGTPLVQGGAVVTGAPLNLATINFISGGGDGYPAFDTVVPVPWTYRQALADYLTIALAGTVTGGYYPEGGEGRIFRSLRVRGVDYPVIAHGAMLQVSAAPLLDSGGSPIVTEVTIGGVAQPYTVQSDVMVAVGPIDDTTPVGAQDMVVTTSAGAFAPYSVTVIHLVINELDYDMTSTDTEEFIELATGVNAAVSLKNYVIVLWNGSAANDAAYDAFELTGSTDADGLYLIGPTSTLAHTPDQFFPGPSMTNRIQNGTDAIGIYRGHADQFPGGTALTNYNLIDAVVYGTAADNVLTQTLLGTGLESVIVAENPITNSLLRCPAGSGRLDGRNYINAAPSPGVANTCP